MAQRFNILRHLETAYKNKDRAEINKLLPEAEKLTGHPRSSLIAWLFFSFSEKDWKRS